MSHTVYIGPKDVGYGAYFDSVPWNFPNNRFFIEDFIWQYPLKIIYQEGYLDELKNVMNLLDKEGRQFTKVDSSGRLVDFYRVYRRSETGEVTEVDSV